VAFIYAHFGVAILLSRRTPWQGFARRLQTSQELFEKKGFTFGNILHRTTLKRAKPFIVTTGQAEPA
jgi:hypothetical protein